MKILNVINEAICDFERQNGVKPEKLRVSSFVIPFIKAESCPYLCAVSFAATDFNDRLFDIPLSAVKSCSAYVDLVSPSPRFPDVRIGFPRLPLTAIE